MLGSAGNLEAQTAHFAGTQSIPFRSGLSQPQGAAVDRNGNVYIADTGNGRVLKEALSGSVYTESTVASAPYPSLKAWRWMGAATSISRITLTTGC